MREMTHPEFEVAKHDEGVVLTFRVPGSKFGPVQVILDATAAKVVASALRRFAGKTETPADKLARTKQAYEDAVRELRESE